MTIKTTWGEYVMREECCQNIQTHEPTSCRSCDAAAEAMLQAQMFNVPDLDQFLAKTLSTTSRLANSRAAGIAIEFSQQVVRACLVEGRLLAPSDLTATLDVLDAIGSSNMGMQRLNNIVAQARQPRR